MNFIIPYYEDERMIYTQKYLVNQGYHEVFDKSKADFAVFSPACDKESFAPYENKTVFYGAGDYDKKHKSSPTWKFKVALKAPARKDQKLIILDTIIYCFPP